MENHTTSTPHDAVFKQFLCHPETAKDFLTIHLPTSLQALCDLQTLRLESASFVEPDLRARYSDVLWSLQTTVGDGYIYVVIEHQSSADAHMAFRLLRYGVAAMQRHLDAGHKTLPLVIPMLFYHGLQSPYPFSLCWLDEFADPTAARGLYCSAFPLVDITVVPDDEIMQHRRVALLELVQKHIRQRDLLALVDQIARLLVTGCATDSQMEALFNYLLRSGDAVRFHEFLQAAVERVPEQKEKIMTIADRLREEGHWEGIKEGVRQEALRIARTMLENGIDAAMVQLITGLSADELASLQH